MIVILNDGKIAISVSYGSVSLTLPNRERMQSLKLFSLKGETLFSADNLMSTHYEMDMSNYEKGIYLLSLTEKNGKTVHYKIIKE